jgi:hypothetical protein
MVVGGDPLRKSVNLFNTQPFINYNIPHGDGWYLVSAPIITADWNAPSGQRWRVPLGGGVGRIFKVEGRAINAQVQAFYNIVRGSISTPGDWQLRFEVALLFQSLSSTALDAQGTRDADRHRRRCCRYRREPSQPRLPARSEC